MKQKRLWIQILIAFVLAICVIFLRGMAGSASQSDIIKAISDGFAIVGLLYLGVGSLLWVSTTGMFDIFGYAFARGAHAILPGRARADIPTDFYAYKMKQREKRGIKPLWTTLAAGAVMVGIALLFTLIWYQIEA